jgi:hypothetical protein
VEECIWEEQRGIIAPTVTSFIMYAAIVQTNYPNAAIAAFPLRKKGNPYRRKAKQHPSRIK